MLIFRTFGKKTHYLNCVLTEQIENPQFKVLNFFLKDIV